MSFVLCDKVAKFDIIQFMKVNNIKIAIVRLSALGDIINSMVVLQLIKKKYPDSTLDWISEEVFAPLLEHHPLISNVHTINLKKLNLKLSKKF